MKVRTVQPEDLDYAHAVADMVFAAYDGQTYKWRLTDTDSLWKIHFGVSAGVVGVAGNERRACVKLFYDRRLKARFRNVFKLSKAQVAYERGQALVEHGIACPAMLGYAENDSGMGLIVSELAEGYEQVDARLGHDTGTLFLSAVGTFLRTMHEAGVSHKDLSPRNMLVKEGSAGGRFSFLLLDGEDTRIASCVSLRKRREELHHFYERIYRLVPEGHRRYLIEAYAIGEDPTGWLRTMEEMVEKRPSKYTR